MSILSNIETEEIKLAQEIQAQLKRMEEELEEITSQMRNAEVVRAAQRVVIELMLDTLDKEIVRFDALVIDEGSPEAYLREGAVSVLTALRDGFRKALA